MHSVTLNIQRWAQTNNQFELTTTNNWISDSQKGWGWTRPLRGIWSNPSPQAGPPRAGCPGIGNWYVVTILSWLQDENSNSFVLWWLVCHPGWRGLKSWSQDLGSAPKRNGYRVWMSGSHTGWHWVEIRSMLFEHRLLLVGVMSTFAEHVKWIPSWWHSSQRLLKVLHLPKGFQSIGPDWKSYKVNLLPPKMCLVWTLGIWHQKFCSVDLLLWVCTTC